MFDLETERLIIRDFRKEDALEYTELRNSDKFKRFYSESDVTKQKSISLLEMFISQSKECPRTKFQLAIALKDGGLIGSCGVRIESEKQASVGCELGRKWQGSRYPYEVSGRLIDLAFQELDIHRIYAETISENKAAIKLCQSLGMRMEAELVENRFFQGRWWNTMIFALLKREWVGHAT